MTYHQDRERLLNKEINCVLITQNFLKSAKSNPNNAFIEIYEEEALRRSAEIDKKLENNSAGKLAGLVFSVKDLISVEGKEVTGGSKILSGYQSPYTATAVHRLLEEDAILIGRTNCDEFGMGSSNENSAYGPVTNHFDLTKVSGGSSGGSAVSVQEGSCHVAIGTDTGGSVRQPASFCGLYGLKPTYSRISRHGLLAYASSFDTIGILASTCEEVSLVYEVMSGFDAKDATSSSKKVPADSISDLTKVGYFKQWMDTEGLSDEIRTEFNHTLNNLRNSGIEVIEYDFPLADYLLPTYYILTTAEASSNLARYDGLRYGFGQTAIKAESLQKSYINTRSEGFGTEVKRRIILGTFVLSASYYDAYYRKAQKARTLITKRTQEILGEIDILISPVTPTTAFSLGMHKKNPVEMYLSDLFTVHASVCGIPAISIPLNLDSNKMPFGIQAMCTDFAEEKLFKFSKYLQTLTN